MNYHYLVLRDKRIAVSAPKRFRPALRHSPLTSNPKPRSSPNSSATRAYARTDP